MENGSLVSRALADPDVWQLIDHLKQQRVSVTNTFSTATVCSKEERKNWTTRMAFCKSKVHSNKTLHFLAHHFIKTFSPLMSDSLPGLYYKGSTNEKILCVFSIDLIQKYFKYTSCYINFRLAAFLSGGVMEKNIISFLHHHHINNKQI